MKKLLSIALVATLILAAGSCKNANNSAEGEAAAEDSTAVVAEGTEAACEAADAAAQGIERIEGIENIDANIFGDAVSFATVEVKPVFEGGDETSFTKWVQENLKYPQTAIDNGEEGKVIVQFVVNKLGKIQDAKVVKSVSKALDAEALRVIESAPNWTPGTQGGNPVSVAYNMPVVFALK